MMDDRMNRERSRYRFAKLFCILAAVFYIIVAVVALGLIKGDERLFETGSMFDGYDSLVFRDKENTGATVEYSDLTEESTEAVREETEEAVETAAYEETVEEEPAEEEPSEEEPEEDTQEYFAFTAVTESSKHLNIRADADLRAKVVGTIPHGDTGYILETGDEWSKVCYKGREGYCSNEYLSLKKISKEEYEEGLKENEPGRETE